MCANPPFKALTLLRVPWLQNLGTAGCPPALTSLRGPYLQKSGSAGRRSVRVYCDDPPCMTEHLWWKLAPPWRPSLNASPCCREPQWYYVFVPYGPRCAEVHRDEPNRPNLAAGCWRNLWCCLPSRAVYHRGKRVGSLLCVVWIETATPVPTCCHAAGFGNAIATCAPSPFCPLTVVTVKWACVAGASVDCVDCDSGAQFKCRPL